VSEEEKSCTGNIEIFHVANASFHRLLGSSTSRHSKPRGRTGQRNFLRLGCGIRGSIPESSVSLAHA
jgi:hypothetical protein